MSKHSNIVNVMSYSTSRKIASSSANADYEFSNIRSGWFEFDYICTQKIVYYYIIVSKMWYNIYTYQYLYKKYIYTMFI